MKVLVVTSEFGGHERGSSITDPAEIEAVLAGENSAKVVQSDHEIATADAPKANIKKEA